MAKYGYEFGKRWDAKVPRYAIKRIVGNFHVSTPDSEIESAIRERIANQGNPEFTPAIIRQSVTFALECHARNRDLYRKVVRP